MKSAKETFGQRLKRMRMKRGLTVTEVAMAANVSASTYREWEYGRAIRGEPYVRLAEILGVTLRELMVGERHSSKALEIADLIEEQVRRLKVELLNVV
jgi:transcriptional regulator with XRE-family HTH domain